MLSLTAQFIDPDFKLHQVVVHCREFAGSHTAEAIAMAFGDMLKSWGITKEKVHVILRDNAQNMEKAMKDADLPSLPCMAHTHTTDSRAPDSARPASEKATTRHLNQMEQYPVHASEPGRTETHPLCLRN